MRIEILRVKEHKRSTPYAIKLKELNVSKLEGEYLDWVPWAMLDHSNKQRQRKHDIQGIHITICVHGNKGHIPRIGHGDRLILFSHTNS